MKKIKILLLMLMVPMLSFAQSRNVPMVEFLGIDFSCVDIVGADETKEQFHTAFDGINTLMHTEKDKYDVGKFLVLNVTSIDTKTAKERIKLHKSDDFASKDESEISIEKIIKAYPSKQGLQLLIIASELNKYDLKGSFIAVVFDGESKIIKSKRYLSGKSGGFGLRNYWAGSFYNSLKAERRNRYRESLNIENEYQFL